MHIPENFGDYWIFWGAELYIRVWWLAMDRYIFMVWLSPSFDTRYCFELAFQCRRFEANQHPIAEVMRDLLKSGVCLVRGNYRGDEGMSIDDKSLVSIDGDPRRRTEPIHDRHKPRNHQLLPECPCMA